MKKEDSKKISMILIAIIITGIIAIPLGDPRLITIAIGLEIFFLFLLIMILKKKYFALYLCAIAGMIVIIGNTFAPPHINIMMTFSKPLNAVLLIIGGYVLQILLVYFSVITLKHDKMQKKQLR